MSEADQWITAEAERNKWHSGPGHQRALDLQQEQRRAAEQRAVEQSRERARQQQEEWQRRQEALTQEAIDRDLEPEKQRRRADYFSHNPYATAAGWESIWKNEIRPALVEQARRQQLEATIEEMRRAGHGRI